MNIFLQGMCIVFLAGIYPVMHDFHVSNTEITYRSAKGTMEVTIHLFIDDMELALAGMTDETLHLCTDEEIPSAEHYLEQYLTEHFAVTGSDGKHYRYEFLGKEAGEDLQSMYCYIEIFDVPAGARLVISNSILVEIFRDQKNIVNLGVDKAKRQYLLFDDDTMTKEVTL